MVIDGKYLFSVDFMAVRALTASTTLKQLFFKRPLCCYLLITHTLLTCDSASVSSALDSRSGTKVAIKKLYRPFQSELFAKRAYRELRLLKHMKHENVRHVARPKFKGPAAPSHLRLVPAGVTCVSAPQVIGLLDVFTADLSLDAFHDL